MLKDYYNEIIPPWDSRYGKLGHIWKCTSWDNMGKGAGKGMYYRIVHELVLNEHATYYINITKDSDAFIHNNIFKRELHKCCNLTEQDYYELTILHSNYRNHIKCPICHKIIPWHNRFNQGYGNHGREYDVVFCSPSHAMFYQYIHLSDYPTRKLGLIKQVMNAFVTINKYNICYLYISNRRNYIIFGCSSVYPEYEQYITINSNIKFISNSKEVAYLCATLELHYGSRYVSISKYQELLSDIQSLVAIRPIANPF